MNRAALTPAIDLTLVPLPSDTPCQVAESLGASPALKVAGSRRCSKLAKAKGKERACDFDEPPSKRAKVIILEDDGPKKKKGQRLGSSNYTALDLNYLLDLCEEVLPLGGKAWHHIETEYNKWASVKSRPIHSGKFLEAKFKAGIIFYITWLYQLN